MKTRFAFTMMELVFVIIVIGILAAVALPRLNKNNLQDAANQLVSHIRYTQHLAMQDNQFDSNDNDWYKERWQIGFHRKTQGSDYEWSYTIFSDGNGDANPNVSDMAINPENRKLYLTGGYSLGTVAYGDEDASPKLNIGHEYGIEDVDFLNGCAIADNRNQRIAFDSLGRPLYEKINKLDTPYMDGAVNMLVQSTCTIELCLSTCATAPADEKIIIEIEPETGYTHIL